MENHIAAQHELCGRIARTVENLKKTGVAKITTALISTTIKLIDKKWERFEEQHEWLRAKCGEELRKHEYFLEDFLGQAEQIYALQRSALLEMAESMTPSKDAARPAVTDAPPPPRTTLPRISLPHFSGRYEDWPAFSSLFQSLIAKDASLTDVTRLHYLKASLKGKAESLIKNLPTTDENFRRAWQVLQNYYENPRLLVRSHYAAYLATPKLKNESAAELRNLFHCATSTFEALESMGRPVNRTDDLFVFLTVELLDQRSRREWENSIGGTSEPPSFAELKQFLERRVHTLEAMQPPKAEMTSSRAKERGSKSVRAHHVQKEAAKKEKDRCPVCHKDHFLMLCDAYRRKSMKERRQVVEDANLCVNCFGKHKVGECQSKRACFVCDERHHSSLHDAFRNSASITTTTELAKTTHVAHRSTEERDDVLLATARVHVRDRAGALHPARALVDQGSEISIVTEALAQRLRLPRVGAPVAVFGVGGRRTAVSRGRVTMSVAA